MNECPRSNACERYNSLPDIGHLDVLSDRDSGIDHVLNMRPMSDAAQSISIQFVIFTQEASFEMGKTSHGDHTIGLLRRITCKFSIQKPVRVSASRLL